jgi:hypothetical protein
MHNFDRREFLKVAGAGLILGAGGLAAWADDRALSKAWKSALAEMKQQRAHGVAIVLPTDPKARAVLAKQLAKIVPIMKGHGSAPEQAIYLLQAVWVVVEAKTVGAKPGETLVLLDSRGKRLEGAKVDLGQSKTFLTGARLLLHGKEGKRLRQRADLAMADPEIKAAIKGALAPKLVYDHYHVLRRRFVAAAPAIALELAAAKNPEVRAWHQRLLGELYWARQRQQSSFPFGVEWKITMFEPEPCPPCGMARPSLSGKAFVRFLTK